MAFPPPSPQIQVASAAAPYLGDVYVDESSTVQLLAVDRLLNTTLHDLLFREAAS